MLFMYVKNIDIDISHRFKKVQTDPSLMSVSMVFIWLSFYVCRSLLVFDAIETILVLAMGDIMYINT